jgi:hypothetical protein
VNKPTLGFSLRNGASQAFKNVNKNVNNAPFEPLQLEIDYKQSFLSTKTKSWAQQTFRYFEM